MKMNDKHTFWDGVAVTAIIVLLVMGIYMAGGLMKEIRCSQGQGFSVGELTYKCVIDR